MNAPAAPATVTSATAAEAHARQGDYLSVNGLHATCEDVINDMFEMGHALAHMGRTLTGKLEILPVPDPVTGQVAVTRASKKAAKDVGQYFLRAASTAMGLSAQMAAAWSKFDKEFLTPAEQASGRQVRPQVTNSFQGLPTPGHPGAARPVSSTPRRY